MDLVNSIAQVMIANVINLILSVCNSFILPKYLSIEAYADFKTFSLYKGYIGILHLGIVDGLFILCGGKKRSEIQEKYSYTKRALLYLEAFVTFICIVIAVAFRDNILLCTSLCIVPINMVALYKMICQAVGEFKEYRMIFNMVSFLIFFFNILCVFVLKVQSAYWFMGINILASMITWLYYAWKERKTYVTGRRIGLLQQIRNLMIYSRQGIIIMIGNFMGIWITGMDKWFVKIYCNIRDFAYYSFAISLTQMLNVVMTAFSVTLYHYFCKSPTDEMVRRLRRVILMTGTSMLFTAYLLDWFVSRYLQKYTKSIGILFIIFAAHYLILVINAVYLNLYKALKIQKKYLYRMFEVMVYGLLLNWGLYFVWERTMRAFAIATFFTAVIWLIKCQRDLPEYKMSLSEWIYMVGIIGIFFISRKIGSEMSGYICGAGFLIYTVILFYKEIYFLKNYFMRRYIS